MPMKKSKIILFKRKGFIFLFSSFLLTINSSAKAKHNEEKPNILFIVADDLASWAVSYNGNSNAYTPEIDNLAREGVLLKNAFVNSPLCTPSRVALHTGRYPSEVGITHNKQPIDPNIKTWQELLHLNGYKTAHVGKWGMQLKEENYPLNCGYMHFTGTIGGLSRSKDPKLIVEGKRKTFEGRYTPDLLADFAMDYILQFKNEPFAISLHFWAPHANTSFPEEFELPYDDRSWLPLKEEDLKPFKDKELIIPNPDFPDLDTNRVKRMMREYYASVHAVDRNVGRIMDFLKKQGLVDNTVVVFTSDNGYMIGHHGLWHKGNGRWITREEKDPTGKYMDGRANVYDLVLKVPAIVRWPRKLEAGKIVEETFEFIDWFPTILAMTGIEKPEDLILRGNDALPLLEGKNIEWGNDLFAQYGSLRTYRTPEYKLVYDFATKDKDEFYHLLTDPLEKENLIDSVELDILGKREEMERYLLKTMWQINDFEFLINK